MACCGGGGSAPDGPPLTSGDLAEVEQARYRVVTDDGVYGFDQYRAAVAWRDANGGRIEA